LARGLLAPDRSEEVAPLEKVHKSK